MQQCPWDSADVIDVIEDNVDMRRVMPDDLHEAEDDSYRLMRIV